MWRWTIISINRRSHDKMLVIDGHYPDKAIVLTGGRNVSLDYYGIFKFQTQPAMLMYDPD